MAVIGPLSTRLPSAISSSMIFSAAQIAATLPLSSITPRP
jgi:hypothetical protein